LLVSLFFSSALSAQGLQELQRGKNRFDFGDCKGAIAILEGVVSSLEIDDEEKLIDANRMLGICYVQGGKNDSAILAFERLLYIDLEQELDPFRTPPPVVELFNDIKRRIRKDIERIGKAKERGQAKKPPPQAFILESETEVWKTPYALNFMPMGIPQFEGGRKISGGILTALQGIAMASAIASMTTFIAIDARDGLDLKVGPSGGQSLVDVGNAFGLATWISLGTALAGYTYGVADALYFYEPERRVEKSGNLRKLGAREAERLLKPLSE